MDKMIEETISQIETRIRRSETIPEGKRKELLDLLADLRAEITGVASTHGPQAESITGLTEAFTQEATRSSRDPQIIEQSIEKLSGSVTEFEKSHPKLVQVVNRICTTLSNLGI